MKPTNTSGPEWEGESLFLLVLLFGVVPTFLWLAGLAASGASPIDRIMIWSGAAAGLALLAYRYRHTLLTPMLRFELVRLARGRRFFWARMAYGFVLLLALFLRYGSHFGYRGSGDFFFSSQVIQAEREQLSLFANEFFLVLVLAQLLAVVLLLPLMTASALAGEKEKRTLEFLLATELSSSEIVLAKLFSCLAAMGLLLLTGLPVLALLQLFGGVEPGLLLAGFLITLATMVGVGGLGLLVSSSCQTSWRAAIFTYLGNVVMLIFPLILLVDLGEQVWTRYRADFILNIGVYMVICSSLGGICCFLAIGGLRARSRQEVAMTQVSGLSPAEQRAMKARRRPPVGDSALLWKEFRGGEII